MGQSGHSAEFADTRDRDEAGIDSGSAPAEHRAKPGCDQTTIDDFYREGMGVAGKE